MQSSKAVPWFLAMRRWDPLVSVKQDPLDLGFVPASPMLNYLHLGTP